MCVVSIHNEKKSRDNVSDIRNKIEEAIFTLLKTSGTIYALGNWRKSFCQHDSLLEVEKIV